MLWDYQRLLTIAGLPNPNILANCQIISVVIQWTSKVENLEMPIKSNYSYKSHNLLKKLLDTLYSIQCHCFLIYPSVILY
ncbi:hypothetical protein TUMEXPCC7403_16065 [Tumidithrix helvetica PCC 7403]